MNDENYKVAIGARLRASRKRKKLTQETLSEKLGISQKHYSEVERGIAGLSVKNLIQISELLEVSLDYLLKGKHHGSTHTENMDENDLINEAILLELYSSVSSYTKQQIIMLLQIIQGIDRQGER